PGLSVIVRIAAGTEHAFALRDDGTLWAWGLNDLGQLGIGMTGGTITTPTRVPNLTNVTEIATYLQHGIALRSDGTVWTWGRNFSGELGIGNFTPSDVPVLVQTGPGVRSVVAGSANCLIIKNDGSVMGWGGGAGSQLGGVSSTLPVPKPQLSNLLSMVAGRFHCLALGPAGEIWAWGDNTYGNLGSGTGAIQP